MPSSYHINAEDGLISLQADASMTLAELNRCVTRLLAEAEFDASLPHLIDLRAAELPALFAGDEQLSRSLVERYNDRVVGSIAVLIDASEPGEHLAHAYRITCGLLDAELFDSYELAMRWLIKKAFVTSQPTPPGAAPAGAIRLSGEQPDSAR